MELEVVWKTNNSLKGKIIKVNTITDEICVKWYQKASRMPGAIDGEWNIWYSCKEFVISLLI